MRLIDADEEIKWANDNLPDAHAGVITAFLRDCATIDAVPVVRCKDCKYWDYGDCYRLELSRADDFCSYGRKRDEENTDAI